MSAIDTLAERAKAVKYEWPALLASTASPTLTSLAALFRDRVIGFTSVVPNPEVAVTPLVQSPHKLESLRAYGLGDYTVSFGPDRSSASDWVEIGMRLRDGSFVR